MRTRRQFEGTGLFVAALGAAALAACSSKPRANDDAARSASVVRSDATLIDAGSISAPSDTADEHADARNEAFVQLPENGGDAHCVPLTVGPRHEPATLCDEIDEGYWRVTSQVVRVVRAGKPVSVLQLMTRIEGYDSGITELDVKLQIDRDGLSATTVDGVERQAESCATPSKIHDSVEFEIGVVPYSKLREKLCHGRGSFHWKRERFVRD